MYQPRVLYTLLITVLLFYFFACCADAAKPGKEKPQKKASVEESSDRPAMTLLQAAVLGAVEGLTEYLPVSSTGHLLITERLMGIGGGVDNQDKNKKEAADAFAISIQGGAILAVLSLYWRRVKGMLMGVLGKDPEGTRMAVNVILGFLPAAIIGFLFNGFIKSYLFGMWPVVLALFAGGVLILTITRWNRETGRDPTSGRPLEELRGKMAIAIGLMQCVAMWPGVSRSLVTILGGVLVGLSLPAAVEFSFLLGLVTLGAATSYDALKHGQVMLAAFSPASILTGLTVAFVFAMISVKWMVSYLNRHDMAVFGYYRIAVAIIATAILMTKTSY